MVGVVFFATGEQSSRIFTACRRAAVLVLAGFAVSAGMAIAADERFQPGDSVEVMFLGDWRPGVILQIDRRGAVGAEYEFAGTQKRGVFAPSQVRLPCEAGAIGPVREWKDASGQFRIRAALIDIQGDQTTLRKLDMSELDVPVKQLSTSDQRYVARLEKDGATSAPRAAKVPPVEQFASQGGFGSSAMSFGGASGRQALTADPLPAYLKLQQGGAGFPVDDIFLRIGAVIPVGGPDGWILAALQSESPNNDTPTFLLWVSLVRQKVESRIALPPGEIVLDYHPPSHRLLTGAQPQSEFGRSGLECPILTVWEVLPTDSNVSPVVRWDSAADNPGERTPWARLTDGNTVIQRRQKNEFVAWDLSAKAMRYRVYQDAFFEHEPTLSGGRKYLFLPEDEQVSIYETKTGALASTLPVPYGASAVAVTEDGRRAATLGRNTLMVWDLTDAGAQPQEYQAESIGSPFEVTLNWISADRLLSSQTPYETVLFDLKHQMALWTYEFDHDAVIEASKGGRVREIIAGHLVYTATIDGINQGLAVGAVSLPGPQVNEAIAAFDPESLVIVKAGSPMSVKVDAGEYNDRVRAAIERAVKENGWILDDNSPNVLTAAMKRGKSQQITYESRETKEKRTATLTPYVSSVSIACDEKLAWATGTRSGFPDEVTLKEGQTLQSEVDRYQKPDPEFFDRLKIPQKISDPMKRKGLGTTKVTNRGLIAGGSPPRGMPQIPSGVSPRGISDSQ